MKHAELRQFIKEANAAHLSPVESQAFQYYYSCTQNEENLWYCPDSQVAADIGKSRSSVCEARNRLKHRGWITETDSFKISVVKTFSTIVGNSTEQEKPQSETRLTSRKLD